MKKLWVAITVPLLLLVGGFSYAAVSSEVPLESSVSQYLATQTGRYSVSAKELSGEQREVNLNGNLQLDSASIFKLYYALLALEKVEQGTWTLSTRMSPQYSLAACLKLMLSYSDNYCTIDIRNQLGISYINDRLLELGFSQSHVLTDGNGKYLSKHTTTEDVATLLSELQKGHLLNAANTKVFINYLKGQVWRARISSALPIGTQVASKSGQLEVASGTIEGDAAIVFGPTSTYVLVVIGTEGAVPAAVREVSRLVYTAWQGSIAKPSSYPARQLVTTKDVYLRSLPAGRKVRLIPANAAISVLYSERGWLLVQYGTRKGYIFYNTVRLSNRYLHWGAL